jgi:hypothetical protein
MESLVSVPALTGHAKTRADRLRLAALAYLARTRVNPVTMPPRTFAAT